MESALPTLSTTSGEITVPDHLIVCMAARMWRLSPTHRAHHVGTARRRIEAEVFGLNDAATVLAIDCGDDHRARPDAANQDIVPARSP
jgi:hypothetical protein